MKIIQDYLKYIKNNPEGYWFKRKLYGWGWTPATWQGWTLTTVFIILVVANAVQFELAGATTDQAWQFVVETFIMIGALILICYRTGEKPRWQWGIPKDEEIKSGREPESE